MSIKLYEKLLKTYKGAKKERKEIIAKEAGYENSGDYKKFLEDTIENYKILDISEERVEKPTIHIVDILDRSGSMSYMKIDNAVLGINSEIERLKSDNSINYTYSLCGFSDWNKINMEYLLIDINTLNRSILNTTYSSTALYDAIGQTLNKIRNGVNQSDKVLVNIYTDGGENDSKEYKQDTVNNLIKELQEKNFTITFIGTDHDVENIINRINIDRSNTLKYDGSAQGLAHSMTFTSVARSIYSSKVISGEDVSKGFYKEITEKKNGN